MGGDHTYAGGGDPDGPGPAGAPGWMGNGCHVAGECASCGDGCEPCGHSDGKSYCLGRYLPTSSDNFCWEPGGNDLYQGYPDGGENFGSDNTWGYCYGSCRPCSELEG